MAIAKRALTEFRARALRNSVKAKHVDASKISALVARQGFVFHTEPRYAQKVCMLLGWKYDAYMFLLGMGAGKTKLILDLFVNRIASGEAKRCLVLVPNIVNLDAWREEVAQHAPQLWVGTVDQSGHAARRAEVMGKADVVVMTYSGLGVLVSELTRVAGKKRRQLKMDDALVRQVAKEFDMLILDESTAIKNPASLWFSIIKRMRKSIRFCYGLTGTPFDKNPEDLWSQFFAIDGGYTLGETLGLFRGAFFKRVEGYFAVEWKYLRKHDAELARRLAHCSVRFSEAECQDLPKAVGGISGDWMVRPFRLGKSQVPYYSKIKSEMIAARGNHQLVDNAYIRTRMVSSGWLGMATPDGDRAEIIFPENPKLDALVALLSEIPEEEQVIVVGWFNTTCRLIMGRLAKEKIEAVLVNGTVSGPAKLKAIKAFKSAGGPRVLVGSTAMGKGLNLQGASRFMIFVESMDSTIERSQIEARILREGGKEGARYYYDLCMVGGVEYKILKSLRTGRALHDVLLDGEVV